MISPKIITEFLGRKLDNFDWIKGCTHPELDAALAELCPKPDFGDLKPWLHQKAIFLILQELKRFMVFVDMGGGKTALSLLLMKYRKQCGEQFKAIVFVPYVTSVATWVDEAALRVPDLHIIPLVGSGADNLARLKGPGDVFVVCYQTAVSMVSEKGKGEWNLTAAQVRRYFEGFDMIVMDEIHKCKSPSSLTYRMCRAISAQCEWALGLTGTPFGKDMSALWPQFNLIDFGETLGPTLGFFREVFYSEKINHWGGREYTFKKKLFKELKRIIKNNSLHYDIDEFYDMPARVPVPIEVDPPIDSVSYCQAAIKNIYELLGNNQGNPIQRIESEYLRLRQLSSGFMTFKNDESKVQVKFDDNPKLEALAAQIEALPPGRKAVVFHHFIYSNKVISDRLTEMKVKHARIWGGQKDPLKELKRFKEDPDCTVLVINWRSGSSSLNLQNANYLFVYEQPDSPIDREQGERRVWRPGQTNRVFIVDLFVKGTWDRRMYDSNKAGRTLLEDLLSGKTQESA